MNSDTTSVLVNLYSKVSGVPIYDLKAYTEPTTSMNLTAVWKILTDLFVNGPFMILDTVVGFISLILRFFENFDLYDTYKRVVYDTSKTLWSNFLGSGNYNNSLAYLGIALTAFVIFIGYVFSKGDIGRRLLHLFAVIMLGLTYFGTIQNTAGGLYILDTINNVADSASNIVSSMSITNPEDSSNQISTSGSVADNYIARTAYAAYLYVNTGRLDGKYLNNQTGQLEEFEDSKIIGWVENGTFQKADSLERDKKKGTLDDLGDGASDGEEKNRWVSAVSNYLFIKILYVCLKIIEAIVLGIPLVLIQIMSFVAKLLVIFLMMAFPLALIVSLIPRMQDVIFNVTKLMLGSMAFPVLTGFLTLMVFYVESIINVFVSNGFNNLSEKDLVSFSDYQPVFELAIGTFLQGITFLMMWKNKERLLALILGQNQARMVTQLADGAATLPNHAQKAGENIYDKASDLATTGLFLAGAGTGLSLTAKDAVAKAVSGLQGEGHYDEISPDSEIEEPSFEESDPDLQENTLYDNEEFEQEGTDFDEVDPDLVEDLSDNAIEPLLEETPDYDELYQEELPDESEATPKQDVAIEDFEEELANEEPTDYQQSTDNANSLEEFEPTLDSDETEDYQTQTDVASLGGTVEDSQTNYPEETSDTSKELPKDYRTYQKQTKIDRLEDELTQYHTSEDLGQLETGESAFRRGLAKTTTKSRQYRMNTKRITEIERQLSELRGEA